MSACEHGPDFHRCGICTVPRSRLAAVEDELAEEKREHRATLAYAKIDPHKLILELQRRFTENEALSDIEMSWEQGWRHRTDEVEAAIEAARDVNQQDSCSTTTTKG